MKCCAVIDTNVLVSALLSDKEDTATVQIAVKLLAGEILPLYNPEILEEYRSVMARKRLNISPDDVHMILSAIEKFGLLITPRPIDEILPDLKDLPFYEVVLDQRDKDAYLVTGNLKHFPKKPFIVTPRQLLDILDQQ